MYALLLLALFTTPAESESLDAIFAGVLRASMAPDRNTERAAFVTCDRAGRLGVRLWPATHQFRAATYRGEVPSDTFAIVHTHPEGIPDPSPNDLSEARRTGLPIYVLTRTAVTRAQPDGSVVRIVWGTPWSVRKDRPPLTCRRFAPRATESR